VTGALALGLGASALWIAILLWSDARPGLRLWPPRQGSWFTAVWAWGLTILIYVGLIRAGTAEWNAVGLPAALRWGAGGALSVSGSVLQGRGLGDLGLKGTSGWRVAPVRTGVYARFDHPQYLGQIAALAGIALISGTLWGWLIVVAACAALLYAGRVETRFLAAGDRPDD
jgi:hypothetical protein